MDYVIRTCAVKGPNACIWMHTFACVHYYPKQLKLLLSVTVTTRVDTLHITNLAEQ